MFRKLSVILTAALYSQAVVSAPAPITEEERRFLMALNVFGGPGVSLSKLRSAEGVGCLDKEGNIVEPRTEKTIDGFELTCMIRSKPKDSEKGVYLWFPSRFSQHCKNFESFDECAAANKNR